MRSWLGLTALICGGLIQSAAAADPVKPPRRNVLCAAMLTDHAFVSLGTPGAPEPLPDVSLVGGSLLPQHVSATFTVTETSRVFTGESEITKYLTGALDLAESLERSSAPAGEATAPFWSAARIKTTALEGALPVISTGGVLAVAAGLVVRPEVMIDVMPMAFAMYGVGILAMRREYASTASHALALVSAQHRERIENDEVGRADDHVAFLRRKLTELVADRATSEAGPPIVFSLPETLAHLLLDVPGADAHPAEVANHRDLVTRELTKMNAGPHVLDPERGTSMMLEVRVEAETSGPPKLIVRAILIRVAGPSGQGPRGPRPGRREIAEEYGAAQPSLVPVRIHR